MKNLILCLSLAFALDALTLPTLSASQTLRNEQIEIAYLEPSNPDFQPFYDGLRARRVLEELRAFLAPLKLPRKIRIEVKQCDKPVQLYEPGGPVVICYEYVAELQKLAAAIPSDGAGAKAVTREDAVVGAFIQAVLQQTAAAVFDMLNTPIWGREQDAADKLAGFLMLQFGPTVARKLIIGAVFFFDASDRTWTGVDFSDVRGTEAQRFYNYLCIAYGFDPTLFADFYKGEGNGKWVSGGRSYELPPSRVFWCPKEYRDTKWAFDTLIMPHVDQDVLQQVLARDWLKPFVE
jgi:Putative metallopeptidase